MFGTPSTDMTRIRVLYDYKAAEDNELTIHEGLQEPSTQHFAEDRQVRFSARSTKLMKNGGWPRI
jgi:hypothetical protein